MPIVGGATSNIMINQIMVGGGIERSCGTVRYLFEGADGVYYDEIFHEEAIGLGEFGVLTLLRSDSGKLKPLAEVLDQRFA